MILVMLLLDTLPILDKVLLLCFLVFFGIVGVQLWALLSVFVTQCRVTDGCLL